jgi:glutamate-1-semialdehyde aminotransferase
VCSLACSSRNRTVRSAAAAGTPRRRGLHALNRRLLLTPFHNMALMAPTTTEADIDRHTDAFDECLAELT